MSVMLKGIRSNKVPVISFAQASCVRSSRPAALDQETFNVMWDLSAPGGEAEECFLRLPQIDYFYDGRDVHLDWMPDVDVPVRSYVPYRSRKLPAQAFGIRFAHSKCEDRHFLHDSYHRHTSILQLPHVTLHRQRRKGSQRCSPAYQPNSRRRSTCLYPWSCQEIIH